ncbi:Vitamin K epoxide reductase family protein [Phycisphaerae bacterium RAS1]|nr:Vitamin K epoxide reductase family protein [Phycisphaerae bacterium RAS1]
MSDTPMSNLAASFGARPARPPQLALRGIAVALAFFGWWLSFDLFRVAGGAVATNPLLAMQCGDDGAGPSACSAVISSPAGYILLGPGFRLPVSALGMAYFAFVGAWYLFVGPTSRRGVWWHALVLLVVGIGLTNSILLTRYMAVELKQWCIGCVAAHAANALIAAVTILSWPRRVKDRSAEPLHPTGSLACATLAAGAALFCLNFILAILLVTNSTAARTAQAYRAIVEDPQFAMWNYQRSPQVEIPLREDDPISGASDAVHTLVVFVDFQCTACREANRVVGDVLDRSPGALRVVYKHFPMDPLCNSAFKQGGHALACRAAYAAEAARAVGGSVSFNKMRKLLYERQERLAGMDFVKFAEEIGLSPPRFEEALQAAAARVAADVALGQELGIKTLPALYLDGRRLEHWRSAKTWDALLGRAASQPSE